MMRAGQIYSASDKSLFDALNQKNVTNADLRDLFLSRGILVSRDTSRKQLALHFSRLCHDFLDYQLLARLFGGSARRDRMTSVRTNKTLDLTIFEAAAQELKTELETAGATVRISGAGGTRLDLEVKYQAVHFNKSDFRQVVSRIATITIEKDAAGMIIHSPFNDDAGEWVGDLIGKVAEKSGDDLAFREIRLPPTVAVVVKNAFFTNLIKSVDGYTLLDVSDVYVARPKQEDGLREDEGDEEQDEADTGVHISKASLRGEGVLQSDELKILSGKGFFISRIIWTAKQPSLDSDIFEFEAQFAEPEDCSGFSYLPRGYYKYQAPSVYNASRAGFTKDEDQRLSKLIDAAARRTLKKLPGVGDD